MFVNEAQVKIYTHSNTTGIHKMHVTDIQWVKNSNHVQNFVRTYEHAASCCIITLTQSLLRINTLAPSRRQALVTNQALAWT